MHGCSRYRRWRCISIFLVYPALSSLWFSFTDWDGLSPTYNVVGLENYLAMPKDPVVIQAVINNLIWTVVTIFFPVVIGLALAMLLNGKVRGKPVIRLIFYTPCVLPLVAIASIWGWLYNPQYGAINSFLRLIGLGSLAQPWLGQDSTALAAVMVPAIWLRVGLPHAAVPSCSAGHQYRHVRGRDGGRSH